MGTPWYKKIPWANIGSFILEWWQSRKKDDKGKTGGSVQPTNNGSNLDNSTNRPVK